LLQIIQTHAYVHILRELNYSSKSSWNQLYYNYKLCTTYDNKEANTGAAWN